MIKQRFSDNQNSVGAIAIIMCTFIKLRELKLAYFVVNFYTVVVKNSYGVNATYITTSYQKSHKLVIFSEAVKFSNSH